MKQRLSPEPTKKREGDSRLDIRAAGSPLNESVLSDFKGLHRN
jgi:hypothetical protein